MTQTINIANRTYSSIKEKALGSDQEAILRKMLRRAEFTEFGEFYNFTSIQESADVVSAFQSAVPIHDYDKIYTEWWSQSLEGKSDVAWRGKTEFFALSSGTSNASSKYIPVTKDMQKCMRKGAFQIFRSVHNFGIPYSTFLKSWLTIGGSASLDKLYSSQIGDLSGINTSTSPFWVRHFKKPEIEIARLKTWQERTDAIVKNAYNWDISTLVGIPSWVQLTLERIIEEHNLDNIHQLWPNLSLFVTGGINFEPYKNTFEQLLGREIQYLDTYLASEGFIAWQNTPSSDMTLMTNNGIFFEFVPFDDEHFDSDGKVISGVTPITLDEIEQGKEYALMITTCAGTWRYLIGDTIVFTDTKNKKIKITGRTSQFLSVCGEHLSVDNLNTAVANVSRKLGIMIKEFSVGAIPDNGHYKHQWYIGQETETDPQLLAQMLDEELMVINDDYRAERGAMLRPPSVTLIPHTVFLSWIEDRGKMNGQSKIPRVFKGKRLNDWMSYVAECGGN